MNTLIAVLQAIIALPKILESIDSGIKNIKLDAINKDYEDRIKKLESDIELFKGAKTDEEKHKALAAINSRK